MTTAMLEKMNSTWTKQISLPILGICSTYLFWLFLKVGWTRQNQILAHALIMGDEQYKHQYQKRINKSRAVMMQSNAFHVCELLWKNLCCMLLYQRRADGSKEGSHAKYDTVNTSQLFQDGGIYSGEDLYKGQRTSKYQQSAQHR